MCSACGESYRPYRLTQRACSRKCRESLGPVPKSERKYTVTCQCQMCNITFMAMATRQMARPSYCDGCRPKALLASKERKNAARRIATAESPEKAKARNRARNLKQYGLTPEQADEMSASQGGQCAICGDAAKPGGTGAAGRLHVDHDHETGKVRALLCNHCNRGVGAFRDRPDLMVLAAMYVESHRLTTSREG